MKRDLLIPGILSGSYPPSAARPETPSRSRSCERLQSLAVLHTASGVQSRLFSDGRNPGARKLGIVLALALLLLFLAACSKGGSSPAQGQVSYGANRELRTTAWESELPADIVLAIDQSGSMSSGSAPTDPSGLRVEGSRSFLEFIASRSNPDSANRFGLVNFGTDAPVASAVPLTRISSIDDPAVSQLRNRFKALNMGDTSFTAALKRAMDLLRAGGSLQENRNRAIVIFTDGEPDDPRKLRMEKYFDEIRDYCQTELRPAHVALFVIGIDSVGKRWTPTAVRWRSIAGDDHVFTTPDMDSLKAHFNRIVQRVWNLPEVESVRVASGKNSDFTVEPYLEAVEFHVFPGKDGLALRINRADRSIVHPGTDPDAPPIKKLSTFDRIIVKDPKPGLWGYQVVGGSGSVEVLRNPIPLRLQLISPSRIHPQGKPMRLVAEFRRLDGSPVPSDRDYPLALSAEVRDPSGRVTPVKFALDRGQKGIYQAEPDVRETGILGEYRAVLKVSGGDKYRSKQEVSIEVRAFPYLVIQQPQTRAVYPLADRIPIRAQLMQAGKPIVPSSVFSNHADQLVIAQTTQTPDGQRGPAVWLRASTDDPSRFEGSAPVPKAIEGQYDVALKLAPEEEQQAAIADQTVLSVTMRQPTWRKYVPWASATAIVVLALGVWDRRRRVKALRFSFYYWTEEMSAPDIVVFRSRSEITELGRAPVRVTRIGKTRHVHIEGLTGTTLLAADGRELPPFDAFENGTIVVRPSSGRAFAMNYGLDQSVSKPAVLSNDDGLDNADAGNETGWEAEPRAGSTVTPPSTQGKGSAGGADDFKWDV